MLSGGIPAAIIVSRNGVVRLFQVGTPRPCLSLPRPVSTTMRRVGVSTTSEWIDIFSRPSSVAKCGISQGSFWISALLAKGRMKRPLVCREIVHHDDVARLERRHEDLRYVSLERRPIHGTVKDHRRSHAGRPERADEGHRLPMAMRERCETALTARRAAIEPGHLGRGSRLVD